MFDPLIFVDPTVGWVLDMSAWQQWTAAYLVFNTLVMTVHRFTISKTAWWNDNHSDHDHWQLSDIIWGQAFACIGVIAVTCMAVHDHHAKVGRFFKRIGRIRLS